MPSANGVYSLPTGYLAVTGATIQASQHNPPLEDIAAALTLRLSRDGSAPMTGPLQLAAGTVTVPGAVFAADASSGFYKTTAGIGVAIGGVKVAEFLPGGINGARVLGELVPFTGITCPPLFVFPHGQTLSRTTYAALWTFAQNEIAAGNLLWNNGDGSTTFGTPDLRGRLPVCNDALDSGVPTNRVTAFSMSPSGTQNGSVGGSQSTQLTQGNLPNVSLPASITDTRTWAVTSINGATPGDAIAQAGTGFQALGIGAGTVTIPSVTVTGGSLSISVGTGGSNTSFSIMQPSIITSYMLFAGA